MTYTPSPHPDIIAMHCKEGRKRRTAPCCPGGIRTRPSVRPTKQMRAARPPGGTYMHTSCVMHCTSCIAHLPGHGQAAVSRGGPRGHLRRSPAQTTARARAGRAGARAGACSRGDRVRGGRSALPAWCHTARGACGAVHTVPVGRSADAATSCTTGRGRRRFELHLRTNQRPAGRHHSRSGGGCEVRVPAHLPKSSPAARRTQGAMEGDRRASGAAHLRGAPQPTSGGSAGLMRMALGRLHRGRALPARRESCVNACERGAYGRREIQGQG